MWQTDRKYHSLSCLVAAKNNRAPLRCYFKLFATFCSHRWIETWVTVRKRPIWVQIDFFEPCDLEIWRMTLKNNRAPLQYYFKVCPSFRSHWWIETGVTVRKCLTWVKIDIIFYLCDLAIWRISLKSNRAPLLSYFKLCAAFRSHWWIQTGVTIRKLLIWVKFDGFQSRMTLKNNRAVLYATSNLMHHFIVIGELKLELHSGNAQFGSNSTILKPCDLEIWHMALKKIGHLFSATSNLVHHFVATGEFKVEL